MGVPISIRLDDDVRLELEQQARARGISLGTLMRDLLTQAATNAQRSRIHQASAAIGERLATSPCAQAFYEAWGTPRADAG